MLPAVLDPQTASPGEREVFQRLQDDPGTADWIVLHSLDISHHVSAIAGEVDFLILVPGKGVLALEVKACRSLSRADSLWYYGELEQGDPRGPFKQAAGAMHSARSLVARHPDLRNVLFWSAVLFPYIRFDERSDEWHSWQVIDNAQFRARPFSELVAGVLESARRFVANRPSARWFNAEAGEPTSRQCEVIATLLRPDFELAQTPSQQRRAREDELRQFTEEQFEGLDAMASNPRVLFEGPAGTGKTILAIEAARRAAANGHRVLFLCFNTMLADWLRQQTAPLGPDVTTRTIHSYMLQIARLPVAETSSFWQSELPAAAVESLVEDEGFEPYDELIVDEAHDKAVSGPRCCRIEELLGGISADRGDVGHGDGCSLEALEGVDRRERDLVV